MFENQSPQALFVSHRVMQAILLAVLLAACSPVAQPTNPTETAPLPGPEQVTPSVSPPVGMVNGEPISSQSFTIHLSLYQTAQTETGTLLASENMQQLVLDDLVNRLLLAQGARAQGFRLDEATLDQRLAMVVGQTGDQAIFDAWLAEQGFTAESFRQELAIEIEAGWMRTELSEAVPLNAEQMLARQILLTDRFQAERLLDQLENNVPFQQVAMNNDAQGLGYLGWFPRGYLLQPAVEEAAFGLQAGETSGIVETSLGFHLIEVLDWQADRPLTQQARLSLQMQALADWLEAQRAQSTIENFLP